jgi:beta-lactam-binding protein with PASTA domain
VTTPPPPRDDDTWPQPATPTIVQTREEYAPPPGPPPPDRRVGAGMLLALGALALVGLGFLITYLVLHRNDHSNAASASSTVSATTAPTTTVRAAAMVPVPDLRGVAVKQARSALSSVGLQPRQTTVAAKGKSAGTVVAESPKPGAHVVKGSQVLLSVARGAPRASTTAPATTSATTTTRAATTSRTATTSPATTAPTSTATTAAPPPSHPQTVTVPDVSNGQESAAVQALGRAGLLPALAFVPSNDPLGTVEAQAKAGGTTLPYHAHVQINLSTGPGQKPTEHVPNVVGEQLRRAVATLNAAHLRLIYLKYPVSSRAQAGAIVQQSPLAGASAPQNAQVLVFMGAYQG